MNQNMMNYQNLNNQNSKETFFDYQLSLAKLLEVNK